MTDQEAQIEVLLTYEISVEKPFATQRKDMGNL